MADISVTASSVSPGADAVLKDFTAGEAITAGQVVYKKAADGRAWLAQNDGTAEEATIDGIAVNSAPAAGMPLKVQSGGDIDPGGTVTIGEIYVASSTAGGIAPEADNDTQDDYVSIIGVGTATDTIKMMVHNSGAQIP